MTHSGGKPHAVGDRGQQYEVRCRFTDGADEQTFGWTASLRGAASMVNSIQLHPSMNSPIVIDRETGKVIPLDIVKAA